MNPKNILNQCNYEEALNSLVSDLVDRNEKPGYYAPKIPREERLCPVCSRKSVESGIVFFSTVYFYND